MFANVCECFWCLRIMMLMVDVLGGETIQTNSTQYEDLRDVNAT